MHVNHKLMKNGNDLTQIMGYGGISQQQNNPDHLILGYQSSVMIVQEDRTYIMECLALMTRAHT